MERIPITIEYNWLRPPSGNLQLMEKALELFVRGDYCIVPDVNNGKVVGASLVRIAHINSRVLVEMRRDKTDPHEETIWAAGRSQGVPPTLQQE